jgi:hypothetical protein
METSVSSSRSSVLAALVVAAIAAPLRAQPAEPPPLPVSRSLYVLDVPFLHFGSLDEAPARPGAVELSFDANYANTFTHTWHAATIDREFGRTGEAFPRELAEELHRRHPQDAIVFIDAEVTRLALAGRVGLGRGISISLEVPWISFSALHLDSGIESFHRLLGLADFQRTLFPNDRFQIVRQRPFGELTYDDTVPRAGLGDVVAKASWRGGSGDGTRLSADVAVKLPTGSADDYRGSGSADVGVAAGISRRFFASRRLGLHLEGAVVVPGRFRGDVPTRLETAPFSRVLAGVDFRIGRRTFVSVSALREQAPYRNSSAGDSGRASVEIVIGLVRRFSPHVRAHLALTENVPRFGDAADVAVAVGLGWQP